MTGLSPAYKTQRFEEKYRKVWLFQKKFVPLHRKYKAVVTMAENMTPETIWYLNQMMAKSEKDFAEGNVYSHEQVKEMLKSRRNENRVVKACI